MKMIRYDIDQDGKMSAYEKGDWVTHKFCLWKLEETDCFEKEFKTCEETYGFGEEEWRQIDGEFCPYCGGEVKLIKEIETHYGESK